MSVWHDLFPTPWGWVAVVLSHGGVRALSLPHATPEGAWAAVAPWGQGARRGEGMGASLRAMLWSYLEGEPVALEEVPVDWEGAPPFFRRVWEACRTIPRGQARPYRWLAEAVGRPGAVRAVGQALARNRLPLLVPCHRVVASDGRLHGYGGGCDLKERLLRLEGCRIVKGKVSLPP
jgi:methylated-DNA-[protein]-cysteine S-methyltransferase